RSPSPSRSCRARSLPSPRACARTRWDAPEPCRAERWRRLDSRASGFSLPLEAEHGRVVPFNHAAVPRVHVDATGQARIEAAHRPHEFDALEVLGAVLLEDGEPLDRVLVRPRLAEAVARAGV